MAQYPIAVLVRMTEAQADRLDEVQAMGVPVSSRAAAVRRLIDSLVDDEINTRAAEVGPSSTSSVAGVSLAGLDPAVVDRIVTAVQARAQAYTELASQVRQLGHLQNALTRRGHQIAIFGTGAIPVEAVEAVGRDVARLLRAVLALEGTDRAADRQVA